MKICSKDSCNRESKVKGMCRPCYTDYWDSINPGRKAARTKASAERNKEKRTIYAAEWRNKNRFKWNFYASKRRLKLRQNGIFKVLDKEFRKLTNSNCFYCGSKDNLTLDHILPIARGGRHSIGNLITACKPCNCQKNKRTIVEWKYGVK